MALTPQKVSAMPAATQPISPEELLYLVQAGNSRNAKIKDMIFGAGVVGSWTPTVGGATTDPTLTYTQQVGNYVKLGRYVFAQFRIDANITDVGAGGLIVRGLPFVPSYSLISVDVGLQTLLTSDGVIGDISGSNVRILNLNGTVASTAILKLGAGILSASSVYVTNTN